MSTTNLTFRPMTANDFTIVADIYQQGIETGHATFQQEVPTWEEWDMDHVKKCRVIALIDDKIAGWAALTKVSGRCVYAGVAEVSVYISKYFRGQNIGKRLLHQLILESEKEKFWTLQAGVFPENIPSINIHEQLGFRKVGYRERIGKLNGKWRDTILMERRSKDIGVD